MKFYRVLMRKGSKKAYAPNAFGSRAEAEYAIKVTKSQRLPQYKGVKFKVV